LLLYLFFKDKEEQQEALLPLLFLFFSSLLLLLKNNNSGAKEGRKEGRTSLSLSLSLPLSRKEGKKEGRKSIMNSEKAVEIQRDILSYLAKSRERLTLDTLRPLPVVLGIRGNNFCIQPTAFTLPSSHIDRTLPPKLTHRMKVNVAYFLTNYVVIAACVSIIVCLLHPMMMFWMCVVSSVWYIHHYMLTVSSSSGEEREEPIILFGKNIHEIISPYNRSVIAMLLTVVVAVFFVFLPFVSVLSITSLIVIVHSALRDPRDIEQALMREENKKSEDETEKLVEDLGEMT
jgi:hypothetical protein